MSLRSMTGFGEGMAESDRLEAAATLRSVNHRFLDLAMRLPDEYRPIEPELAQRLRAALDRGRVELKVSVKLRETRSLEVDVDEELAARYVAASNQLAEQDGVQRALASGDLLRLPEVVSVASQDHGPGAGDRETVLNALDRALESLIASRAQEGRNLAAVLKKTLANLEGVVDLLAQSGSELQQKLHDNMHERIGALLGEAGLDPDRLAQEIALLVDRADVKEEIDRLRVHVDRFGALLDSEAAVGKRLDFLAQEILRELNTIGSKCRNSSAIQIVLDGKVLCEQLREQVQNVE